VPRGRKKATIRSALPANELKAKIMELIRHREARRKIKGVEFVYVGSVGSEPNWFARPLPVPVSDACMREFVSALGQVRKAHDLLFDSVPPPCLVNLSCQCLPSASAVVRGCADID
jgi:hypothetical protein